MNAPTPAAPLEPAPMTINEVEALARQLITVPIGALIMTQQIQTSFDADRPNIVRWSISHFPPNNVTNCTLGEGPNPHAAISHLIQQLTPCDSSTPSA